MRPIYDSFFWFNYAVCQSACVWKNQHQAPKRKALKWAVVTVEGSGRAPRTLFFQYKLSNEKKPSALRDAFGVKPVWKCGSDH